MTIVELSRTLGFLLTEWAGGEQRLRTTGKLGTATTVAAAAATATATARTHARTHTLVTFGPACVVCGDQQTDKWAKSECTTRRQNERGGR